MNHLVNLWAKAAAALPLLDPVVEIGSFQVPGQEGMADLRRYFPGRAYIGTDMRPGPGVDQVEDVHCLSFADESVGTILMLETLEHVTDPKRALSEVKRVLRPGGVLILSTPFDIGIHNYPDDYWRFTPEAYNVLLKPIGARIIGSVGPQSDPVSVLGAALVGVEAAKAEQWCVGLANLYRQELQRSQEIRRERRLYEYQRRLTSWLPFQEVRRAYRRRSHLFDVRFRFHASDHARKLT